jgi:hypothetical protein
MEPAGGRIAQRPIEYLLPLDDEGFQLALAHRLDVLGFDLNLKTLRWRPDNS